jgi:AraC family transcriptional regulator, regulatory protein of adaptative response / DNA-3-methyladenine glycosylase II
MPKARNCRFFACAAAAEEAGFRACLRCRPETAPGTRAWLGTSATVSCALRLIDQGVLDETTEDGLAVRLGVTARHLRRLFAEHLGTTPGAIARTRRTHFARRLIVDTSLSMTGIAFSSGFKSIRQFNAAIQNSFHRSPTEMRRRIRGTRAPVDGLVFRLAYRPPCDWAGLLGFLRHRAIPGIERVDGEVYRRTIEIDGIAGWIEVRPVPREAHLHLRIHAPVSTAIIGVVERVRRLFDLNADPLAIEKHLGKDPQLAAALGAHAGVRVPGAWDGFEIAVRAILGQQVTVKGATTLCGRLVRSFGVPHGEAAGGLTHLFPRPETLADADLSALGIPQARAEALRALARAVRSRRMSFEPCSNPEELVARFRALPGIGPWTAQYIAMRLGEIDALPASDLGLRRALAAGRLPAAAEVERRAEAWRPWRAYAVMLLWLQDASERVNASVEEAA